MRKIEMVDLKSQYISIKQEIDLAIQNCLDNSIFIKGEPVQKFQKKFEEYLGVRNVIPCANGTDALQIAIMALGLEKGDEVIVPAFTYVATVEVILLLGLVPVYVDVEYDTFNINTDAVEASITERTRLIVPVHLFGQCANMDSILKIGEIHDLYIIEDTAQAIGSDYIFEDKLSRKAGTLGNIGCTSFFPSKNLGCYGDGGALITDDDDLAEKIRMIANHGQAKQYYHEIVGVNSRLDSIQAAVLDIKLNLLDHYNEKRLKVANHYDLNLANIPDIILPTRAKCSNHVFHQYTIKVLNGKRDVLKDFLRSKSIPTMIYYPLPVHHQKAFSSVSKINDSFIISERLCNEVLSLPIHTEFDSEQLVYVTDAIQSFYE